MKRVNEMLEAARRHADGVNAQLSEAEARNATLSAEVSRLSAGSGGVGGAAAVTSHELSLTATQHELRSQIATLKQELRTANAGVVEIRSRRAGPQRRGAERRARVEEARRWATEDAIR